MPQVAQTEHQRRHLLPVGRDDHPGQGPADEFLVQEAWQFPGIGGVNVVEHCVDRLDTARAPHRGGIGELDARQDEVTVKSDGLTDQREIRGPGDDPAAAGHREAPRRVRRGLDRLGGQYPAQVTGCRGEQQQAIAEVIVQRRREQLRRQHLRQCRQVQTQGDRDVLRRHAFRVLPRGRHRDRRRARYRRDDEQHRQAAWQAQGDARETGFDRQGAEANVEAQPWQRDHDPADVEVRVEDETKAAACATGSCGPGQADLRQLQRPEVQRGQVLPVDGGCAGRRRPGDSPVQRRKARQAPAHVHAGAGGRRALREPGPPGPEIHHQLREPGVEAANQVTGQAERPDRGDAQAVQSEVKAGYQVADERQVAQRGTQTLDTEQRGEPPRTAPAEIGEPGEDQTQLADLDDEAEVAELEIEAQAQGRQSRSEDIGEVGQRQTEQAE